MFIRSLVLALTVSCAASSLAGVTSAEVYRSVSYAQTSDSTVFDSLGSLGVHLKLESDGDITDATLSGPTGNTISGSAFVSEFDFSDDDPDLSQFVSRYGAGSYGVSISGGNLAGQSGGFDLPAFMAGDFVPLLTGTSLTRLTQGDPDADQTLTLSLPATPLAAGAVANSYFTLFDINDGIVVLSEFASAWGMSEVFIPKGTVVKGHDYLYGYIVTAEGSIDAEFDGDPVTAYAMSTFSNSAVITVGASPVPEPVPTAALGLGAVAVLRRRKKA